MTKLLYLSTLCSQNKLDYLFRTSKAKPIQSAQKFHRLIVEGLGMQANCELTVFSAIPVTPDRHGKKVWGAQKEVIHDTPYHYLPFINIRYIKNISIFLATFIKTFFWGISDPKNKIIVCDILNISMATAGLWAGKLSGTKVVTIVTDMNNLIVSNTGKKNWFYSLYKHIIPDHTTSFDGYILLTKAMNPIVNPKDKPYMIMEGLVDVNMQSSQNKLTDKSEERILLYAGGLYERYGLVSLIQAFSTLKDPLARLYLYGHGPLVKNLGHYTEKDPRIKYLGVVPNAEVVAQQLKATLLINPRPTTEEFTKYSFPSKNMEYMVSGTPMVTTKLPGMPPDHFDYVYFFDQEDAVGMARSLHHILELNAAELHAFGQQAKDFVLKKKNNQVQAGRIIAFVESILNKSTPSS